MKAVVHFFRFLILLISLCAVELAESPAELTLNCRFRQRASYACLVQGLENHVDATVVSKVTGVHVKPKSNDDVDELWINGQNTKFIPEKIGSFFPNLQRFEVRDSSLVSLSKRNFEGLESLETVILENNFIESLSANVFEDLTKLKNLRLRGNKLTELDHKLFSTNVELEIISLDDNRISWLHENQFASLTNLRRVYMRNNEIVELREQTFANNLKLTTVDFSNNKLSIVGPELLKNLAELTKFDFGNNECIKKDYKTIDEITQIFYSKCFPPYFKRYEEKLNELKEIQEAVNSTLSTCESNLEEEKQKTEDIKAQLQSLSDEKEKLEGENDECISERESCNSKLNVCESEKESNNVDHKEINKNLTECLSSLENTTFISAATEENLKRTSNCVSQRNILLHVIKLSNSTIFDLQSKLEENSIEIEKLKNQVSILKADKQQSIPAIAEPALQLKAPNEVPHSSNANCENQQSNELIEAKAKLAMKETQLKLALAQLPSTSCNSFLIVCSFHKTSNPESYNCIAKHVSACQPGMKLMRVEGTHERYKSNTNVEILEIQESIFHFPDDIFKHLPNLHTIRVTNSGLSSLQPGLKSLQLRKLEILENQFVEIPQRIFENVGNLDTLNLEGNKIQTLHSDSFAGLSYLRQLSLKENLISDLPSKVFIELESLTALSLSNNRLNSLNGDLFASNTKLQTVQFNENSDLKYIDENLFDSLVSLRMAQFRGTCVGSSLDISIDDVKESFRTRCYRQ